MRKGCGGVTPQELLDLATQDRFALIFDEKYKDPAMENIRELYQLCPTTGILVRQTSGGETYHVAPLRYAGDILKNGFRVRTGRDGDFLTYGGGVIYTYPALAQYTGLDDRAHAVFRILYGPGTLRAIATFDKNDREQGEILVPPECVVSYERVTTKGELYNETHQ